MLLTSMDLAPGAAKELAAAAASTSNVVSVVEVSGSSANRRRPPASVCGLCYFFQRHLRSFCPMTNAVDIVWISCMQPTAASGDTQGEQTKAGLQPFGRGQLGRRDFEGVVSFNCAVFGSVLLSSLLPSDQVGPQESHTWLAYHTLSEWLTLASQCVFAHITLAMELFALAPRWCRQVKSFSADLYYQCA